MLPEGKQRVKGEEVPWQSRNPGMLPWAQQSSRSLCNCIRGSPLGPALCDELLHISACPQKHPKCIKWPGLPSVYSDPCVAQEFHHLFCRALLVGTRVYFRRVFNSTRKYWVNGTRYKKHLEDESFPPKDQPVERTGSREVGFNTQFTNNFMPGLLSLC